MEKQTCPMTKRFPKHLVLFEDWYSSNSLAKVSSRVLNVSARTLKAEIHIIKDRCKGCGFCIQYCPRKVLGESNEINTFGVYPPRIVDENKCILCSLCMSICPDFAIFVVENKEQNENAGRS